LGLPRYGLGSSYFACKLDFWGISEELDIWCFSGITSRNHKESTRIFWQTKKTSPQV
jgi:hypothetical protein